MLISKILSSRGETLYQSIEIDIKASSRIDWSIIHHTFLKGQSTQVHAVQKLQSLPRHIIPDVVLFLQEIQTGRKLQIRLGKLCDEHGKTAAKGDFGFYSTSACCSIAYMQDFHDLLSMDGLRHC